VPDQRRARTASPAVGMNVEHVNIADMEKSVIQHPVTDNFFVQVGDEAIAGNDFPANKLAAFVFKLRDKVKRAKRVNVIFNGWANRDHISRSMNTVVN
jgi:exo-beta-1,3-glucanase (GH17 family)